MKSQAVTSEHVDAATEELKETVRATIDSIVRTVKNIDWQMVAKTVIPLLLLIYGIRNRSLIKGIVASVIAEIIAQKPTEHITVIARDLMNKASAKN
jgi:hypothetical protein